MNVIQYDPPKAVSRGLRIACWLVALGVTAFAFYPRFTGAEFLSGDTWSYLALSDTIFSDFYHVHHIREFQYHSFYPAWFPPLYAIVWGATRLVWDQGVYTGFFLNIGLLIASYAVFNGIFRLLKLPYVCGLVVYCSLLCFQPLMIEAERSRGMPLAVLVYSVAFYLFLRHDGHSLPATFGLAFAAGLCPLARFDLLPIMLIVGCGHLYLCRTRRIAHLLIASLGFLIALSPWITYSLVHFRKPFVSEYTYIATLAVPSPSTATYYPPVDAPPETVFTAPGLWLKYFFTLKLKYVVESVLTIFFNLFPLQILLGLNLYHRTTRPESMFRDEIGKKTLIFAIATVFGLIPVAIGGNGLFVRYYTIQTVFVLLFLTYLLRDWLTAGLTPRNSAILACVVGLTTCAYQVAELNYTTMIRQPPVLQTRHTDVHQYDDIVAVLDASGRAEPRISFLKGKTVDGVTNQKFSALAKRDSVLFPENYDADNVDKWVNEYRMTHLYDDGGIVKAKNLMRAYELKETAVPHLYEIVPKSVQ